MAANSFSGFTNADFDAYLEPKWASNRFNLERMRAREKLQALASAAFAVCGASDLELVVEATHDHPTIFNHKRVDAQWVFFSRPEAARKRLALVIDKEHPLHRRIEDPAPHHLHAILSLRLDASGLEVGLRMHRNAWVDVRNLLNRAQSEVGRTELLGHLGALGDDMVVGLGGTPLAPAEVTTDHITAAATAFSPDGDAQWLHCSKLLARSEPQLGSPALVADVASLLGRLLPIYRFGAWSEANDHLSLRERMSEDRRRAEEERRRNAPRPIEENAAVLVKHGMFSGHRGLVEELDGMGGLKVRIGTLSVHLMTRDVELVQSGG